MDTKSKILLVILALFVAGAVYMTYQRTMVKQAFYTIESDSDGSTTDSQ